MRQKKSYLTHCFRLTATLFSISVVAFDLNAQEVDSNTGMIEQRPSGAAAGRVSEIPAAAIVQIEAPSRARGSRALQDSVTVPELISPLEGAVLDNGRTDFMDLIVWDFDWSDVPGATQYNLYVIGASAQNPVIDIVINTSSYHHESQAWTGYYHGWTWKVRAMINGVWGAFSASRTFDVEPVNTDPPSVPLLISPPIGAVLDNGRTDRLDPMVWDFDWSDVPGATQYNLYVIHQNAPNPAINVNVSASSYHEESNAYTYAYSGWTWKVRAMVNGVWGAFSPRRTFNVEPVNTDPPFVAAPILISPPDNAVLDNGRTDGLDFEVWDFDWSDVPNASQYNLYVIGASAQNPVIDTVVSASAYHRESGGYIIDANRLGWTWKVRAMVKGTWGSFSAARTFEVEPVNTDPPGPAGMTSAHANLGVANQTILHWSADAQLVMLGTHQSNLTSTGKAAMWFYIYHSASLDSEQVVILSNDSVLAQGPIWQPPSEVVLPGNWNDSPPAMSTAEAHGGNAYRATNRNVSVFGSLARGFLQHDTQRAVWRLYYASSTSSPLTIFVDAITGVIVSVEEQTVSDEIPRSYALQQNYPNPFNPTTTITFALPKASFVTLKIYDLLGNEVATLVVEKLPAGKHQRVWEAKGLASGVYLYRLEAGEFVQTRKLILLQ